MLEPYRNLFCKEYANPLLDLILQFKRAAYKKCHFQEDLNSIYSLSTPLSFYVVQFHNFVSGTCCSIVVSLPPTLPIVLDKLIISWCILLTTLTVVFKQIVFLQAFLFNFSTAFLVVSNNQCGFCLQNSTFHSNFANLCDESRNKLIMLFLQATISDLCN